MREFEVWRFFDQKFSKNRNFIQEITRYIPVTQKHELPEKCQFPGCCKPAEVIHHPHRYGLRPNHDNLKPLCKAHHELVHNGEEPIEWKPQTTVFIDKKFQVAMKM